MHHFPYDAQQLSHIHSRATLHYDLTVTDVSRCDNARDQQHSSRLLNLGGGLVRASTLFVWFLRSFAPTIICFVVHTHTPFARIISILMFMLLNATSLARNGLQPQIDDALISSHTHLALRGLFVHLTFLNLAPLVPADTGIILVSRICNS